MSERRAEKDRSAGAYIIRNVIDCDRAIHA